MPAGLHLGFKLVERAIGFVVEVCPTCRQPRVCEIAALGRRPVLNFILPAGPMTVLGHQAKCCECGRIFTAEAAFYPDVSPERLGLGELLQRTNPALSGDAKTKEAATRTDQILQRLLESDHMVAERFSKGTVVDLRTGMAFALVVAVLASAIWLIGSDERVAYVWGAALLLAIANVAHSMIGARPRFIRTKIAARLREHFLRMGVAPAEIDAAYSRLHRYEYPIAKYLDRSWLV